jgi:hypothetical protein
MFGKRSKEQVASGPRENVDEPGLYLVKVTSAYDSNVVFPQDIGAKSRHLGLSMQVVDVAANGESSEDLEDRKGQIGRFTNARIYMSENNVQTAISLLNEICGDEADLPKPFEGEVTVRVKDGVPELNLKLVAEHAPFNPGQMIGRLFLANLSLNRNGKNLDLQIFSSWMADEALQAVEPRSIFDGVDTVSAEVKERIDKSNARKNGEATEATFSKETNRKEGLRVDEAQLQSVEDDLPY